MSSIENDDTVEATIVTFAAEAPRAMASSPSACARRWNAVGATRIGVAIGSPSTVAEQSTAPTSTSTRGRTTQRS
jgi:hypothetical protein